MRISMARLGFLLFVLLMSAAAATPDDAQARAKSAEFDQKMREAYRRKDWPAVLEGAQKAEGLRPGPPRLVFNLASAHARLGHAEEAARLLEGLLSRGLDFDISEDPNYA